MADLSSVETDEDLLSVSELGRALWFAPPAQLPEYLAAHTWLRRRLSEYLDCDPAEIGFSKGEHGKPAIATPTTELSFNLAYSCGMAVLVVGFRNAVGIDIESIEGSRVDPKVMRRMLTPAEKKSVLRSADRDRAYLQHWVRKKSLAKANGLGVSQDMKAVDLGGPSPVAAGGYEVTDINLGSDFVAAVAAPPGTHIDVTIVATETAPIRTLALAPAVGLSPPQQAGVGR